MENIIATNLCELSHTLFDLLLVNETVHVLINVPHNILNLLFIQLFNFMFLAGVNYILIDIFLAKLGVKV